MDVITFFGHPFNIQKPRIVERSVWYSDVTDPGTERTLEALISYRARL
jgi:hypothetical protein